MALSTWGRQEIADNFLRSARDWTRKWTSGTPSPCLPSWSLRSLVWRLQPGPPKDFQPIRNRSLNKELSVRTSSETVLFFHSLVSILNVFAWSNSVLYTLTRLVWLLFSKIYKLLIYWRSGYTYCLVYKSALYLWEKSSLVTRRCLKISHCFLYRWIVFSYSYN